MYTACQFPEAQYTVYWQIQNSVRIEWYLIYTRKLLYTTGQLTIALPTVLN